MISEGLDLSLHARDSLDRDFASVYTRTYFHQLRMRSDIAYQPNVTEKNVLLNIRLATNYKISAKRKELGRKAVLRPFVLSYRASLTVRNKNLLVIHQNH